MYIIIVCDVKEISGSCIVWSHIKKCINACLPVMEVKRRT